MERKIAFLGAGHLAEAMFSGLVRNGYPAERIAVTNKQNTERLKKHEEAYNIQGLRKASEALHGAEIVILAMKPKDAHDAIHAVKPYITNEQMVISVIAGLPSESISKALGTDNPVVRAMPNTSAQVLESATAVAPGPNACDSHVEIAKTLFEAIGEVFVVEERDMHLVTALAGSGPAYIYRFIELAAETGENFGLDLELSRALTRQVLIGAAEMLKQNGDAGGLRKRVTSPGGTTEAGLKALEASMKQAVYEAIKAAKNRSESMADE